MNTSKYNKRFSIIALLAMLITLVQPFLNDIVYADTNEKVGSVHVLKTDKDSGVGLEGVELSLETDENVQLDTVKTDGNGMAKFENIPTGQYIVRELSTIDGYTLDETNYDVSVKSNDVHDLKLVATKNNIGYSVEEKVVEEEVVDEEVVEQEVADEEVADEEVADEEVVDEEVVDEEVVDEEVVDEEVVDDEVVDEEVVDEEMSKVSLIKPTSARDITLEQLGGNTTHFARELMPHNIRFAYSNNSDTLLNHSIVLKVDKEFVDSIKVTRPTESTGVEYVSDADFHYAKIKFDRILSSYEFNLPVQTKFNHRGFAPNGYQTTVQAYIEDENGAIKKEANDIYFKLKYGEPNFYVLNPNADDVRAYTKNGKIELDLRNQAVRYSYQTGSGIYDPDKTFRKISSYEITETIPDGATFDPNLIINGEKVNTGWRLLSGSNKITKKVDLDTPVLSDYVRDKVYFTFPNIKLPYVGNLSPEITLTPYNKAGYENETNLNATRELYFKSEPLGELFRTFTYGGDDKVLDFISEKKEMQSWQHEISVPSVEIELENFVMDTYLDENNNFDLDDRLEYAELRISEFNYKRLENIKVYSYSDDNGTLVDVTNAKEFVDSRVSNYYRYPVPENSKGIRLVTDTSDQFSGRSITLNFLSRFKNPENVSYDESNLQNNLFKGYGNFSATYKLPSGESVTFDGKDSTDIRIVKGEEKLKSVMRNMSYSEKTYLKDDTFRFIAYPLDGTVSNVINYDRDRYFENLRSVIMLPSGLDVTYVTFNGLNVNDVPYRVDNNYKNSGKKAVIIDYPDGKFEKPSDLGTRISVKVNELSLEGSNEIEVYTTAKSGLDGIELLKTMPDIYDIDNNNNDSEQILHANYSYDYAPAKEVVSRKYIKGANTEFTPIGTGVGMGETVEYNLNVTNFLDSTVDYLTIYDVLPYENDRSIVGDSNGNKKERGSNFENELLGKVSTPSGFTVYYSYDEPLDDVVDAVKQMNWVTTPDDYGKVKAIKITMNNGRRLSENEVVNFTFEMKTPNQYLGFDSKAFNSMATSTNNERSFYESNKVFNEMIADTGSVKISKTDKVSGTPLQGVEFVIEDLNGVEIARDTTDRNGQLTFDDLLVGEYKVRETKALDGYQQNNQTYDVSITKNQVAELSVENERVNKVDINVVKKWVDTHPELRPDTLKYYVLRQQKDTFRKEKVGEGVATKDNNYAFTFKNLMKYDNNGDEYIYTVGEERTPYLYSYDIGDAEKIGDNTFQITNTQRYAEIQIVKHEGLGETSFNENFTGNRIAKFFTNLTNTGQANMAGATFHLLDQRTNEIIDRVTLDENGQGSFKNVNFGNYYIQEIKAPKGYQLDDTKYEANVDSLGEYAKYLFKTYNPKLKNITVEKKWQGTELNDTTIALFADGEQIDSIMLNKNSNWTHTFENLPAVNNFNDRKEIIYTVEEEVVPEGYRVQVDGSVADGFVITNREVGKVVLPDTGGIGMLLIISIVGALLFFGKKQQKN